MRNRNFAFAVPFVLAAMEFGSQTVESRVPAASTVPVHMVVTAEARHGTDVPVIKREDHRQALLRAATGGSPKFFLGTDSAPHPVREKESACGCAGCFTAPLALSMYAECFEQLTPGGAFLNLEHVASATERLQDQFLAAMDMTREEEDRSNILLDVWTQVRWLEELGFEDADCHWKWRELALLGGVKPALR